MTNRQQYEILKISTGIVLTYKKDIIKKNMLNYDRTLKLEELIEKFEALKKDLAPAEEKLNEELKKIKQQIIDRARARTSFTGDQIKDLCIFKFGREFRENFEQLVALNNILKKHTGEFILIHDTSYNLLINVLKETDRCYIPFRVAALGIIDEKPLDTGYEHDITGDRYYLKLRFKDGAYIRELEIKEHGKLDKWLNVLPTFRGREERYTEVSEPIKLIMPARDYQSSEDYIRKIYTDYQEPNDLPEKEQLKTEPKKPYWKIAPDRFEVSMTKITPGNVVEVYEEQEFPKKMHKVFALYIGNQEVAGRTGLDLARLSTVRRLYDALTSSKAPSESTGLIF